MIKNGIILLDKPKQESSFFQISKLRKILGIKKIGHCGTLDPMATGLLVVCINKATKITELFMNRSKEYIAEIKFGFSTTTDDIEGEIINKSDKIINENELILALKKFVGEIEQVPPLYSAIKIKGKRAYELARKNQKFEIAKRKIYISEIELINFNKIEQIVKIRINCSKGTYVRSIARDLGVILGSYAYLNSLVRTRSGDFCLSSKMLLHNFDFVKKEDIINYIIPISESLSFIKYLKIKKDSEKKIEYGQKLNGLDIDWNNSFYENINYLKDKEYYKIYNDKKDTLAIVKSDLSYKCVLV